MVKQISVFLENKSGRLADVTRTLGTNNIDISALSIADTTDFGILRLIVNNPLKAEEILKKEGFTVSSTDVLAIAVEDEPGGLSQALTVLEENAIDIEYIYAFVGKRSNEALVILRLDKPCDAIKVLGKNNVKVLEQEDIYHL